MMKKPVKAGVVGVGSLGQHHARVYSELEGVELAGVFDVNLEQAKAIADKHNTKAFDSLEAFAREVDAASVVVPTDLHKKVSELLMKQKVHLLVEKPIAATTDEAEFMVKTAQENGVLLQVGHIERFNPVMEYLEKAAIQPRFIEAHRLAPYPPPREGMHPRGTEVSVVLDLMIHDLEVILHLVRSPVKAVHAVGVPVLSPSEDIANVRLVFENGCVANITASRVSPERMRKIRVFLEDAYISLDYQEQSGELFRKKNVAIEREEVPIDKREPLANELRSFTSCVKHQNEPVVSGQHASDALKLAAKISQQLKEGSS